MTFCDDVSCRSLLLLPILFHVKPSHESMVCLGAQVLPEHCARLPSLSSEDKKAYAAVAAEVARACR